MSAVLPLGQSPTSRSALIRGTATGTPSLAGTRSVFTDLDGHVTSPGGDWGGGGSVHLQMAPELEKVELGDRPVDHPGGMLGLVAWGLVMASEDFDELIIGRPWKGRIDEIGGRLVALVQA